MYTFDLNFNLPIPWNNELFEMKEIGFINYLLGANGTGKSQFAEQLKNYFTPKGLKCRVLSADRLIGFGFTTKMDVWHDGANSIINKPHINDGFNKENFDRYINGAEYLNTGTDAFVLLEKKLDLKIKIEAIISQVINRDLRLEWDSGRLIPMAYNSVKGNDYELKKESHGIKELIILLTHIYDDSHKVLIIDEPELNLHPQYQSFLLEHIRKVSGNPDEGKKIVYLISHSPFILDFQTIDDIKSIICFHNDFRKPSFIENLKSEDEERLKQIIPKLNVHHKQLFFADTPIFVEGIFDTQFIKAIQEKRGISIEGSGSTVIDVGGNEQLGSYYLLSKLLGKKSLFIYDLDSIYFSPQLRINAEGSEEINQFLVDLGLVNNFKELWGVFNTKVDELLKELRTKDSAFKIYIDSISSSDKKKTKKEKYALLVFLIHKKDDAKKLSSNSSQIDLILNQLIKVIESLERIGIYILPKGAMENHFPSYAGNIFNIDDAKKQDVLNTEIEWMINECSSEKDLKGRYQELYEIINKLPSGDKIDYKKVIQSNLRDLIHKVQKGLAENKILSETHIDSYIGKEWNSYQRILTITELNVKNQTCKINLNDLWGYGKISIDIEKNKNYSTEDFIKKDKYE